MGMVIVGLATMGAAFFSALSRRFFDLAYSDLRLDRLNQRDKNL
jgi:hypothetical protein